MPQIIGALELLLWKPVKSKISNISNRGFLLFVSQLFLICAGLFHKFINFQFDFMHEIIHISE